MNIKTKLFVGAIFLACVPAIVATLIVESKSLQIGEQAIESQISNKLVAARELTSKSLEFYFEMIQEQVRTFSDDRMIVDAMRDFGSSFNLYSAESPNLPPIADMRRSLTNYYENDFGKVYKQNNPELSFNARPLIDKLDPNALALQFSLISHNKNPLGEKDALVTLDSSSYYSEYHEYYHPPIRHFLKSFGYYDIFLVDIDSGKVVYSVFKELDYATSLTSGAYASSGLAQAFNAAKSLTKNESAIVDFKPYTPSYEAPSAFIASPIFDNGQRIGVLVFQMPVERINQVVTYDQNWKEAGLGKTGETFLVGQDGFMRSLGRKFIENPETYATQMAGLLDDRAINNIDRRGTTIGLQKININVVDNAFRNGKSGSSLVTGYSGEKVYAAYEPLNINGLNWMIISTIHQDEGLASLNRLRSSIIWAGVIAVGLAVILGTMVAWFLGRHIGKPIDNTVDMLRDIAEGDGDLTKRMDESRNDELGELGRYFNCFAGNIQGLMQELNRVTTNIHASSENLTSVSISTTKAIDYQHQNTENIASAITQMTASIGEVVRNTQDASSSAQITTDSAKDGLTLFEQSVVSLNTLSNEVSKTAEVVEQFASDSSEIESMLTVIEGIAEQTNLLALNAAIEAARAGETGRGFAVVADEVRSLAQKTQGSTHQIKEIIERLRSGSNVALDGSQRSKQSSLECVNMSETVKEAFLSITQQIANINELNMQIASASSEQSSTSNEIQKNIIDISDSTSSTRDEMESISASSDELLQLANNIGEQLSKYRI